MFVYRRFSTWGLSFHVNPLLFVLLVVPLWIATELLKLTLFVAWGILKLLVEGTWQVLLLFADGLIAGYQRVQSGLRQAAMQARRSAKQDRENGTGGAES